MRSLGQVGVTGVFIPNMQIKVVIPRSPVGTVWARICPLPSVHQNVSIQVRLLFEVFATVTADSARVRTYITSIFCPQTQ